ncbi:hypothetical protein BMS3Abin07_02495 [bacterium BMS3Abin07]|nr:hypothetical protein BMS3Abin07_02495 [bacterium BMS3Abin07]GBE33390.1 hypothetical protein BMS3Bbin05_02331 [bacterium BMS3Bbin05]
MMHMGNFGGMGYGGFGFGSIFMILFWVILIIVAVYLVKMYFGKTRQEPGHETAEDVLKRRYAAGDISKEEFNERMEVLKKT